MVALQLIGINCAPCDEEPMRLDKVSSGGPRLTFERETTTLTIQRLLSLLDRWCLLMIGRQLQGAKCHLRLWDGTTVALSDVPPDGTVVVNDRATLWHLIVQPELAFGEGYTDGRIAIEGDLT